MNSPICITPSKPNRAGAGRPRSVFAALALATLLAGCAGDKPDPARPIDPALPAAPASSETDKGQGNLTFHYANKTTDANLAIDLSSTDVYLEMTGKAAQEQADQLRAQEGKAEHKAGSSARKPAAPAEDGKASEPKNDEGDESDKDAKADPPAPAAAKGLHKGPPKKPEPPPEEDPADYEDVTSKVLAGIRRAQELFYQKHYPEALQAARSSLDARPTAEGYALLGSIYFMQGQTGMARRQWLEALRLNPDMPSVVNMLEKTRTPGGRGSPSPRPVYHPPARPADPEAPYPEEYSSPSPEPAAPAAPAASAAPAAPTAAPATATSAPVPPVVASPQPEDDGDEDTSSAPAAQPSPKAADKAVAPARPAPAQSASKAPAAAPKAPASKTSAASASAKSVPGKKP